MSGQPGTAETVKVCAGQWHRPVAFTAGSPGAGVCLCGRFVWQPVDRRLEVKETKRG